MTDFAHQLAGMRRSIRRYINTMALNYDMADEVASDTILAAWHHRDRFEEGSDLRAWVMTIAKNRFLTLRRKGTHVACSIDDIPEHLHPGQMGDQEAALHLSDTLAALDRLKPKFRDAIVNAALGETATGITERTRVYRGREYLRHDLKL